MDKDFLVVAIGIFAGCTLFIWGVAACLKYFVGLKSLPTARTNLVVGIPYLLLSTTGLIFVPFSDFGYLAPLAVAPGAILVYWFMYQEFKEKWIDDPGQLPEGVDVENEDWRVGMKTLLITAFFFAFAVGIRFLFRIFGDVIK